MDIDMNFEQKTYIDIGIEMANEMVSEMSLDIVKPIIIEPTIFTLVYCMLHDDGWMIKGHHEYVPYGYKPPHSPDNINKCECCDWYMMGVISYDGKNVKIIETIRINYDRFNGGFHFCQYPCEITDEKGNYIGYEYEYDEEYDEESPLYKWFDNIVQLKLDTDCLDESFVLLNL